MTVSFKQIVNQIIKWFLVFSCLIVLLSTYWWTKIDLLLTSSSEPS